MVTIVALKTLRHHVNHIVHTLHSSNLPCRALSAGLQNQIIAI